MNRTRALIPIASRRQPYKVLGTINGKQYMVIVAGGHGKLGSKLGDYVIAFTLADAGK